MKITILEPLGVGEDKLRSLAKEISDLGHELVIYKDKSSDPQVLKERVGDSDILVIANSPLKEEVIRVGKNLKMISVAFTGVDHVDLDICRERNIIVSNAAGYSTPSVAELSFGLILSLLRNILPLDRIAREGGTKDGYSQNDLSGKRLGVVGTGAIGSRVCQIALAFGCQVVAYSRSEKEELKEKGVKYVALDDLMKSSDIVSIHLPLKAETRGIIDEERIGMMKESALLINAARGPIIDNAALARALNDGKIAGAGIDVFDTEPPLDRDYPLLKAKNTLVTPHIAFATAEAMERRAKIVFDNIDGFLKGQPQNLV